MVFSVDLAFTLLLSPVPINLLLQTASNRLPGDDSSALRRLQGLGNGRDRGPDIAQLRRQYHGVVGLGQLRSEEHTSELQSRPHLVCRLLLEKKKGGTILKYL